MSVDLLRRTPRPDEQQVKDALGGVLCRCTGYHAIVRAVLGAADDTPADMPAAGKALVHRQWQPSDRGRYDLDSSPVDREVVRRGFVYIDTSGHRLRPGAEHPLDCRVIRGPRQAAF